MEREERWTENILRWKVNVERNKAKLMKTKKKVCCSWGDNNYRFQSKKRKETEKTEIKNSEQRQQTEHTLLITESQKYIWETRNYLKKKCIIVIQKKYGTEKQTNMRKDTEAGKINNIWILKSWSKYKKLNHIAKLNIAIIKSRI